LKNAMLLTSNGIKDLMRKRQEKSAFFVKQIIF